MTPASVALAFGCSVKIARQIITSHPGDFLYAVWELGPIRCHCRPRQWWLDQQPASADKIFAAWNRMRRRQRRCA